MSILDEDDSPVEDLVPLDPAAEIELLTTENRELREANTELRSVIAGLNAQIAELRGDLETALRTGRVSGRIQSGKIKGLTAGIQQAALTQRVSVDEISRLNAEVGRLGKQVSALERENSALRTEKKI